MKKRLIGLGAHVLVLSALATSALAVDLGLITGGEKGTYYQFGLNLQQLVKSGGTNLTVYNSKGSIENIYAVYQRPATQMGIVQSDVLAFVARVQTNPVLKRIAKKTRMVFPLYNEEILSEKLDWLIQNGHPKWKSVDLQYPLKGWEQYDCVRKHLGKPIQSATRPRSAESNPVMEAIKEILSE